MSERENIWYLQREIGHAPFWDRYVHAGCYVIDTRLFKPGDSPFWPGGYESQEETKE